MWVGASPFAGASKSDVQGKKFQCFCRLTNLGTFWPCTITWDNVSRTVCVEFNFDSHKCANRLKQSNSVRRVGPGQVVAFYDDCTTDSTCLGGGTVAATNFQEEIAVD